MEGSMTNYIPAKLIVMPKDDEKDYNPEQEQRDEDRIFDVVFENDLYEREEGLSNG
jgi:hypothetical protein